MENLSDVATWPLLSLVFIFALFSLYFCVKNECKKRKRVAAQVEQVLAVKVEDGGWAKTANEATSTNDEELADVSVSASKETCRRRISMEHRMSTERKISQERELLKGSRNGEEPIDKDYNTEESVTSLDSLTLKDSPKPKYRRKSQTTQASPDRRVSLQSQASLDRRVSLQNQALGERRVSVQSQASVDRRVSLQSQALQDRRISLQSQASVDRRVSLQSQALQDRRISLQSQAPVDRRVSLQGQALQDRRISLQSQAPVDRRVSLQSQASYGDRRTSLEVQKGRSSRPHNFKTELEAFGKDFAERMSPGFEVDEDAERMSVDSAYDTLSPSPSADRRGIFDFFPSADFHENGATDYRHFDDSRRKGPEERRGIDVSDPRDATRRHRDSQWLLPEYLDAGLRPQDDKIPLYKIVEGDDLDKEIFAFQSMQISESPVQNVKDQIRMSKNHLAPPPIVVECHL